VDVRPIFEWLVDGAPGARTPVELIARLCPDLVRAGVPIDRGEAFVRTLHPHIVGRSFVWTAEGGVEVRENSYAYLRSPAFLESPVAEVFDTGRTVRARLEGYSDYVAMPVRFLSGQVHAMIFATRAPGGFRDEHLAAVESIVRPLSRIAEIFALARTAANLLDAYVGHNAGERILAGHIQRGDTDSLQAVLWFSDLRDFTSMSAALGPGDTIRVLNDLFDCQVPAIEEEGGEVLKFMGDGLLAIFPFGDADRPPGRLCDAALAAAGRAFEALARRNQRRAAAGEPSIRFGLALHVGEVAYGNIGGSGRLDFTCIGAAVNLAARLEGLTGRLELPIVVSADFARLSSRPMRSLGVFELKGVAEPTEVYAPT
jgi:adenylate cyclase